MHIDFCCCETQVCHKRKVQSEKPEKAISPDPLECLFKKEIEGYNGNFARVHIAKMLKNQNNDDLTDNSLPNLVEDGVNMW